MGTVIGVVATSLVGVVLAVAASVGLSATLGQDPTEPASSQNVPVYGRR